MHLSEKAIEPPGEARPDLAIFCDYAARMDFRDRDGAPLITWSDPEAAFEAWKRCSRGRPCDYSGLTYDTLRAGSGVQWPYTAEHPESLERLYADGRFNTDADFCEDYGHDLSTGASRTEQEYRALGLNGRALLHAAEHEPPPEETSEQYPYQLTTGRTVYHFHTRTKTGRSRQLAAAAPGMWVEIGAHDAATLGVREGDRLRLESARGAIEAPARITPLRPGVLFVPFHYGYWDAQDGDAPTYTRAANELTRTSWDPVSKQPMFKVSAVRVTKLSSGLGPAPAPTTGAGAPCDDRVSPTVGGEAADASSAIGGTS